MQAISSQAHAISVDASGKSCKKMKVEFLKNEKQCVFDYERDTPSRTLTDAQDQRNNRKPEDVKGRKYESEAARKVRVDLQGSDLWRRFHEIGTEMIITKAGRRMFPSVRIRVHNLDPLQQYSIAMDIMPVDSKRYRYVYHSSQWVVAGNTDHSCVSPHLYVHPDSPCSGESWTRQVISFDRVKLSNNEMDDKGHIILKSMHKYKPRIHVILHSPPECPSHTLPSADGVYIFSFPETQFTTVTAYQNQQITKLKIDRNPFAKGFRERNGGALDGILESYSRHSPFNHNFKSIAMELQGRCYGSSTSFGITSSLTSFLPNSFPQSTHPNAFPSPQCCKIFPSNGFLAYRAYCNICLDKLNSYTGLRPTLDLPFMTALQLKKADSCRSHWLHDSTNAGSSVHPVHRSLAEWASGDHRAENDNMASAFVSPYRYSFPMSHRLFTVPHHSKLAHGESPVHQMPMISSISYGP